MHLVLEISLQAKDKSGNMHNVKAIGMGRFITYVDFFEKGLSSNSIDYEFYIDGEMVDIYRSALFNTYMEANCFNLIKIIKIKE